MADLLSFDEKNTCIHKLCGVTKLIFFLLWSVVSMITYDTRILCIMFVISLILFIVARVEWKQVSSVFGFIMFFMIINLLAIFLFSPGEGASIYGTETVLHRFSEHYYISREQLFYEFNVFIKYLTIVPSVFIFVIATNPSEFAASLNAVGVSYKVGYAIAIALRYIPDVQDDFHRIRNAQEARGIEMTGKAPLLSRIKNTSAILFPLIFSSMERIDVISNAMELRCFGKNRKRTWCAGRKLRTADYLVIVFSVLFAAAALFVTFRNGSRFYNPFVN